MKDIDLNSYQTTFFENEILKHQTISTIYSSLYAPDSKFINNILSVRGDSEILFTLEEDSSNLTIYTYNFTHPYTQIPFKGKSIKVLDSYIIKKNETGTELCVQVSSKLSGIPMIENFISMTLYIFKEAESNVSLTVKYRMDFLKNPGFLKGTIQSRGESENKEFVKEVVLVQLNKILYGEEEAPEALEEVEKKDEENACSCFSFFNYDEWEYLIYASDF